MKLDRDRWTACCGCEAPSGGLVLYCPRCGRPLTEEAWAGLERRLDAQLPNEPLTLEELREMVREPVWLQRKLVTLSGWNVLRGIRGEVDEVEFADGLVLSPSCNGKTWLAYRRRPEEVAPCLAWY